ncbi:TPA: HU family DNA-binding protein [Vibrio parahaemolyticus]|uniref:HU family DNA-binding protein n=1 Tax=Vibrio parahaemolyticus TaxID=670 RepID=UPI0015DDA403|nr:HU family DNA-binding protein [Vibrio parahaemolyticus]MBE3985612.1 HU family DNA-binding protein [Vibrio parahaemolyticus]MBE4286388.1 HU family DNA-binding protein [Vibrio parahaemolyticus]HCG7330429.1 HU family DNA-binding protein [Vibrio parahaemolyticus]HCG8859891.1 HU family DNA-binding protein [Vibrio parahaemolyticus]HCG9589007.1 HU family DNA-binding protein [Vibrio parahaemolyticus]
MSAITKRQVKREIHKRLFDSSRGTKPFCDGLVDAFIEVISEQTMQHGREVSVHGLGTFLPVNKAERVGRAPKTKELQTIPARTRMSFAAYRSFKEKLDARISHKNQGSIK